MSLKTLALCSALSPLVALSITASALQPKPAELRLTIATLHAAALTTPRAASDTDDAPYLLVSILGPGSKTGTIHLPASGHLLIHLDEALGARPLADFSLQPGDSVRLLVSVLEDSQVLLSDEGQAATTSTKALSQPPAERASALAPGLAPMTQQGAHWLGSAALLLTNENGAIYWRSLDCVATCKVLNAPAGMALTVGGKPEAGVIELSGAGGTYHLQLKSERPS
jgi:hypothetical protein